MRNRESSFELLRILAMFLVFAVHANFQSIGMPTQQEIVSAPGSCFARVVFQHFALVCVNVFILISGYFGIRPKLKSVLNIVFMVVFWKGLLVATGFASGGFFSAVVNSFKGWFVGTYMELVLVAPLLNALADGADKRAFARYVWIYVGLEIVVSQFIPVWSVFGGGFNLLSLMGLYLLGRYMKVCPQPWMFAARWKYAAIYLGLTFASAGMVFALIRGGIPPDCAFGSLGILANKLFAQYTSWWVMINSVCLFLFFRNMSFSSAAVNFIAASTFPMFLSHGIPLYGQCVRRLYASYSGAVVVAVIVGLIIVWMVATVFVDQIRKILWSFLLKVLKTVKLVGE